MRKIISVLLGFLVLAIAVACSQPTETADSTIKIGFIAPLTGDNSNYGTGELNSAKIAVDEINSRGGINGQEIELIVEDGKCNGKDAAAAAQKLINVDKVEVISGGTCSGETLAIAPIAEENKVVLLSAFSTSPDLADAGDYIFRNIPSDEYSGIDTAKYAVNHYKKIGIISENTEYAQGLKNVFIREYEKMGGMIVSDEIYEQQSKDFRTQILKVKESMPDAIFVDPQSSVGGGLLARQIRELGINLPIIGNFAYSGDDALRGAGEAAEGLVFIDIPTLPDDASASDFMRKYEERYSQKPESDYGAGARYDGIYIISDAIRKVGYDAEMIKEYFYNIKVKGVLGEYSFDENGEIIGISYAVKEIKEGKVITR